MKTIQTLVARRFARAWPKLTKDQASLLASIKFPCC